MPQKRNLLSSSRLGKGKDAAKKYHRGDQLRQAHGGRILPWSSEESSRQGREFFSKYSQLNFKNMP